MIAIRFSRFNGGRIQAGKTNKEDTMFLGKFYDVTKDFYQCLAVMGLEYKDKEIKVDIDKHLEMTLKITLKEKE